MTLLSRLLKAGGTGILACAVILVLAHCRSGPYNDPPRYLMPETRSTAARWLNEALVSSGIGVSEVAGDEVRLSWNEIRRLSDKRQMLVERELIFSRIYNIDRPKRPGEWWEVKVYASGGIITFQFEEDTDAAKFESAARRLRQTITPAEESAIAKKYLYHLEGRAEFYLKEKDKYVMRNGRRVKNPEWSNPEAAAGTLRALTGKDFGTDAKQWRKYLEDTYGI